MRIRLLAPIGLFALLLGVSMACTKETEPAASDAGAAPAPSAVTAAPATDPAATVPATTPTPQPQPVARDAGADAAKDATAADAAADAAATDAGKTDGGASLAGCVAKCQVVLATCLQPQIPKDGGLMTLGDPTKCKAASDACQAACK